MLLLKGCVSQDFYSPFLFMNPIRPLTSSLKYFRIRFQFCWNIPIFKKLCSVHPTAESSSKVCITPQSQMVKISWKTLLCVYHCWVELRSVFFTADTSSAVCITPQSQAPWCASQSGVKLLTTESKSKSLWVSVCF